MQKPGKVIVVSQHYPPDQSTTAAIMAAIANRLAKEVDVLVLSGWPGSASKSAADRPAVEEIKNRMPDKAALLKRATAELLFTARTFFALLRRLEPGDVALTVTAPFVLPYAVAAAARLKRARSILIMHDLFPEVLVLSGLLKPGSIVTRAMRAMNGLMFRALTTVVIIGRDSEKLLLSYRGMTRDKIEFIPNWTTIDPAVRPVAADNAFRRGLSGRFIVGLSGNLGFTHDPVIVFEAARRLKDDPGIHFLLSGWGMGFDELRSMQSEAKLANITLVDRVADEELQDFLSAADLWLIPYRKDVAGVSVPSRFYNLLAVGRPVILISEPDAEAALTVAEHDLGWVVTPGIPAQLAEAIRAASRTPDPTLPERAVAVARSYSPERALTGYAALIQRLIGSEERYRELRS
ncbi:glycosyltransferase family 4 protein [Bradyrhizobium sp. Arg237L]|uniref:glycosyltransferase family 4 protein n=1 Tax=Bradyrhizobium sp. Arg237L TaxID=3003352 RepID=UPI00249DB16B|nr:glycosyltransferase family 4 protein [Bradyrhizobium sp. Arg237L]MDI4233070.1 glycosyltransferase family 4 protein [Bradyrhizobium sp. Arg237L]